MTRAATGTLVADAVARGRAVAAFNVITLEHAEAIVAGASRAGRGVVLQLSENAIRFHGGFLPILLASAALADEASVPVALHLDHIASRVLTEALIATGPDLGASSIMVDASTLDYADNVATTTELAAAAHVAGLWVEAELGEVGGKDGAHAPGVRTDPVEAAAFVAATGVDALAVAVGSSHAMRDQTAALDLDLIAQLASRVPVPLVLHGSSGVDDATLAAAVEAGIRKVNIGTALNIAGTGAVREWLAANPDAVDPRPFTTASRDAMADVVAHVVNLLG